MNIKELRELEAQLKEIKQLKEDQFLTKNDSGEYWIIDNQGQEIKELKVMDDPSDIESHIDDNYNPSDLINALGITERKALESLLIHEKKSYISFKKDIIIL